jgi:hypothetical protein
MSWAKTNWPECICQFPARTENVRKGKSLTAGVEIVRAHGSTKVLDNIEASVNLQTVSRTVVIANKKGTGLARGPALKFQRVQPLQKRVAPMAANATDVPQTTEPPRHSAMAFLLESGTRHRVIDGDISVLLQALTRRSSLLNIRFGYWSMSR